MAAQRFRKKPVEIEAMQWTGSNEAEVRELAADCFYRIDDEDRPHTDDPRRMPRHRTDLLRARDPSRARARRTVHRSMKEGL